MSSEFNEGQPAPERQVYLDVLDTLTAELDGLWLSHPEAYSSRKPLVFKKRLGFLNSAYIEIYPSLLPNPDIPEETLKFIDASERGSVRVKTFDSDMVYQLREDGGHRYLSKSPNVSLLGLGGLEGFAVRETEIEEVDDPNEVQDLTDLVRGAKFKYVQW